MISLTVDTLRDLLAAAAAGNLAQLQIVLEQNGLADQGLLPDGGSTGPQDLGRFQYGGQVARVVRPGSLAGILCSAADGGFFLRTNEEAAQDPENGPAAASPARESDRSIDPSDHPSHDGAVCDYAWRHSDAEIIVPADSDVCLYTLEDGRRILDHAPATLGLKRVFVGAGQNGRALSALRVGFGKTA